MRRGVVKSKSYKKTRKLVIDLSKNNINLRKLQGINISIDNITPGINQEIVQDRISTKNDNTEQKKIIGSVARAAGIAGVSIKGRKKFEYLGKPRLMPNEDTEETKNNRDSKNGILKED